MSTPQWAAELAAEFWRQAGGEEPFPRGLRDPILASSFDLTIEAMADLSVAGVERYLARQGRALSCDQIDRPLRGCLVAENGGAFVFLDARDEQAERTFSLAHELAHFLRDYWQPRRQVVEALGESVLEVLDGLRPPTGAERLHALLRRAPVGCHKHLMRRDRGALPPAVREAEEDADRLALELLAPAAEVRRRSAGDRAGCAALLRRDFGLPHAVAGAYPQALWPPEETQPLLARLRAAVRGQAGGRGHEQRP
jgi:hypothetical protein